MKTLIKNILVLAVILGTSNSYANATLEVLTTNHEVKIGNHISVSDASGAVLYSGTINSNGEITRLFDFSKLKDGIYTVEINKDFEIEINSIIVKNSIVTFRKENTKKIFKPVFRTEDSKLLISKLAFDTNEMMVELYYGSDLIFTETVEGQETLNRIYKLDCNEKGEYTAIITSNNRVFVETFKL